MLISAAGLFEPFMPSKNGEDNSLPSDPQFSQNTTEPAASDSQSILHSEIIVIGAGAAGLAAARTLQSSGHKVFILEARNRIGGRLWTNRNLGNIALDMGASWIHGIQGNPLTTLAKQYNARTVPTNYDSYQLYNTNGAALSNAQMEKVDLRLTNLLSELDSLRENMQADDLTDISLKKAFDQAIARKIFTVQELRELNFAINTTIEHEEGGDVADMSLFNWDQDLDNIGTDGLFPQGYDQIINGLARGLDIRLGQIVNKIAYDSKGVTLTTNKGVFTAERALITLPLGVLKSGSVTFSPSLPTLKLNALQNLGMGILNKVYLLFPSVFWEKDTEVFGYISADKGQWGETYNFNKYLGKPILLAFNAATFGLQIEKFTDNQIIQGAMTVLQTIFGSSIPQPQGWLITRWGADPFAGGSYSYIRPGGSGDDYDILAAPIANRLFFAGEATHSDHPATVHGAYLSGTREAKRIANL